MSSFLNSGKLLNNNHPDKIRCFKFDVLVRTSSGYILVVGILMVWYNHGSK